MIDNDLKKSNPFELTKASDFTDNEILENWVELGERKTFISLLKPHSLLPMFVLGSKGSGKTHLMRFCSATVRKLRAPDQPFVEVVKKEGYLGIYIRADGLNAGRFAGKAQNADVWRAVFNFYFELWVAQITLRTLSDVLNSDPTLLRQEEKFVYDVLECFDQAPSFEKATISALIEYFHKTQREMDVKINNCALTHKLDVSIQFTSGRMLFGIPKVIATCFPILKNAIIIYLIDELENFTEEQQKFINSLIRYRTGRCTFKVGARLYGVRTFQTEGSGETNKEGSEFEVFLLDTFIRESQFYPTFARKLCAKRLFEAGIVSDITDIEGLTKSVDQYLDEPSSDEFYHEACRELVSKYDRESTTRPYFKKLSQQLLEVVANDALIPDIVELLRVPDHPLLEKANILLFYQRWRGNKDVGRVAKTVHDLCERFLSNQRRVPEYKQLLDHYKSDLLAQLYRDCGRQPVYAGLQTMIDISQGVPRNFLGLLKHIYRRSLFNGEQPFQKGKISVDTQQDGVRDAAAWFLEDAQPDAHGTDVRTSIDRLAGLLKEIRFSDRPAECAISTFSVRISELTDRAAATLKNAQNWSFLLKVRDGAKDKNVNIIREKLQINSILAPRWDLSVSRRGAIELDKRLANAIFDSDKSEEYLSLLAARVSTMKAPHFGRKTHSDLSGHLDFGDDEA